MGRLGELGLGLPLLRRPLPLPLLFLLLRLLPLLLPLMPLLLHLPPLQLLHRLGAWLQVGPLRLWLGRRGFVQVERLGEQGLGLLLLSVLQLRSPLLLSPLLLPLLPLLLHLLPPLLHLLHPPLPLLPL